MFLKWYLRDEDLLEEADRLADDWRAERAVLIEPGHLPYEFVHAIVRAMRRQRFSQVQADQAIAEFVRLSRRFNFPAWQPVVQGGARLATALGVNFYDACYLQVARMEGVPLLTADEAFYRQAGAQPDVRWLGDYQSAS